MSRQPQTASEKHSFKVSKKTLKKVLTQKPGGGIINELSPRGGGCSLKIKQPSEINPVL